MRGSPQTKGTFLLILGLLVTQFGLLLTLHQTTLMNPLVNIVKNLETVELLGVLMMLIGSVLIVISTMSLMYSLVVGSVQDEMKTIGNQMSRVMETVREETAQLRSNVAAANLRDCKFCGEPINKDAPFCTSCGKAQG